MSQIRAKERRDDILNGNIIKTTFTLAWPVMIGNILSTVYNLADTFWLGQIGEQAVSIPSISWPIVFLFLSLSMGLATAGISLVSQHMGGGRYEKANKAAGQVFSLLLLTSIGISMLGYIGARWILVILVGAPQTILPLGTKYLQLMFLGLPFMFLFMASRFIFRGIGDMKTSLYLRVISIVVDGVLNPFLIFGIGPFPALGVIGAGVTNLLGRGVASILAVYLLFTNKRGINVDISNLKPEIGWIKQIFKIGAPSSLARGGSALAFVVLTGLVASFGTTSLSAYAIGRRMTQLINIGIWGFTSSVSTMVGQNVGDQNMERAEAIVKKALFVSGAIMFSAASLLFLIRRPLIRVFINDPAVIQGASSYVAIFVFSIPFFGFYRIISSAFRGSGHTKPSMALSLGRLWGLRIGISYFLAFILGLKSYGLWWGMSLSNFVTAFISYPWFLTGNWKEETVTHS